jgi:bifunctional non-homologous end joining protein LigD
MKNAKPKTRSKPRAKSRPVAKPAKPSPKAPASSRANASSGVASGAARNSAAALPITVTHPDKVFWPEEGYTKLDLVQFYNAIFPSLSPYVEDRILSLERCPDGMNGQCFYQKEKPKGLPPGTPTKRIRHAGSSSESTNYVVGGALETQLALANLGCIAVHVTGSRASTPRQPDWLCFDLDPQSDKFADAARASQYVRESLEAIKLAPYVKTSGSRGMHVFVPLRVGPGADEVLSFAQSFVGRLAAAHPRELTTEHSIAARGDRVYLDPFRNGFAQTVVAPYSVRRRPHAPVSMPLAWSEVKPSLDPASFNIGNLAGWSKRADPWKDFFAAPQDLQQAATLLDKL